MDEPSSRMKPILQVVPAGRAIKHRPPRGDLRGSTMIWELFMWQPRKTWRFTWRPEILYASHVLRGGLRGGHTFLRGGLRGHIENI